MCLTFDRRHGIAEPAAEVGVLLVLEGKGDDGLELVKLGVDIRWASD